MKKSLAIAFSLIVLVSAGSPTRSSAGALHSKFLHEEYPSANPYVKEGLVAFWDGEWNVGFQSHDSDSPIWKDISGNGHDIDVSNAEIGDSSVTIYNSNLKAYFEERNWPEATVECVANPHTMMSGALIWAKNPNWIGGLILLWNNGDTYYPWASLFRETGYGNAVKVRQLVYGSGDQRLYIDGEKAAQKNSQIDSRNVLTEWTFGEYNGARMATATYYTVRIYDRVLTEEELRWNYSIDCERFGL